MGLYLPPGRTALVRSKTGHEDDHQGTAPPQPGTYGPPQIRDDPTARLQLEPVRDVHHLRLYCFVDHDRHGPAWRVMTKVRAPLSFSLAITKVIGVIGWANAGRITRRANRTLRHWSESDRKGTPTLDQAIALDRAFIEAGGDYAPILESYARQLNVTLAASMACHAALGEDIAAVSRETADAIGASIQIIQPGASPTAVHCAIAETEEAGVRLTRLLGRLRSFLPGNGAGQGKAGVI